MKSLIISCLLVTFAACISQSDAIEKNYLVSLRKAEFLSIIKCISISRDPIFALNMELAKRNCLPEFLQLIRNARKNT
ncbi:hypothetical protein CEXT_102791 [Caerostris extrusa]|uniref:Uncharacterized protein n=1 Tax=Caerostris extrusa TaxID=172846 RepID=A0AAV4QF44_CAEEX|nr:hypothetical protein CEXT_102791 [Caerostris extrusa]